MRKEGKKKKNTCSGPALRTSASIQIRLDDLNFEKSSYVPNCRFLFGKFAYRYSRSIVAWVIMGLIPNVLEHQGQISIVYLNEAQRTDGANRLG